MKQRLTAFFLSFVMIMSVCLPAYASEEAVPAAAEETAGPEDAGGSVGTVSAASGKIGGVNWSFSGGVLLVAGNGPLAESDPAFAGGGQPWHAFKTQITGLVIANGVTGIGERVFSGCAALADVALPVSVASVGQGAFSGTGVRDVTVSNAACAIARDPFALGTPALTVIHGYAGSTAQAYAQEYGYRFEALGVAAPGPEAAAPEPETIASAPVADSSASDTVAPAPEVDSSASDTIVPAPEADSSASDTVVAQKSAPQLLSVTGSNSGLTITWGKVSGAAKYRVFYKNSRGGWSKIADTTGTSYTWKKAKIGTGYTFTVRCISSNGKKYTSDYDTAGISYKLLAKPVLSVSPEGDQIALSWKEVPGAAQYRVFLKNGKKWEQVADVPGTSYAMPAVSGRSYTFTVRCLDSRGDYASGYNTAGKKITFVSAPEIASVSAASAGVTVKWGKVPGAAKYRVFYKNSRGGWSKIADTTGTSYTWKKAKTNTDYLFTVRCISSNGKSYTSSYDQAGVRFRLLTTPSFSVNADADRISVSWNTIPGAAGYRVFLKNGSKWGAVADVTGTSYAMPAVGGRSYTFTVRCLDSRGDYASGYNTAGKKISFVGMPRVSSVSDSGNGVTVKWGKVSGAAKYRLFYKIDSGTWTKVADTTGTSYTWKNAKRGTTYAFTVRCISSDGKSYTSSYDGTGMSIYYADVPNIAKVANVSDGFRIT